MSMKQHAGSLRSVLGSVAGAALLAVACGSDSQSAPNGSGAGATGGGAGQGGTAGGTAGVAGSGASAGKGGSAGSGGPTGGTGSSGAPNVAGAGAGGVMAGAGGVAGRGAAGGGSGGGAGSSGGGGGDAAMAGVAGMASGGSAGAGGTAGMGAAGSGTAGSGGSGGAVVVGDCPTETSPIGWAAASGDSVSGTTGGIGGRTVTPANATELMDYAESAEPLIIRIEGTFDVPRLNVSSNKTLVGIGSDATINGGVRIRGYDDAMIQNVIVQNLHVNGGSTDVDDDAMQIYFAHHVWIDHSDIYDGPDGNLDITHASNWITISWTKFRYTSAYQTPSGEDSDHRFSNLLGHSDNNASEDSGRMKVTLHHNWYAERVIERMPRVRFGQVHVFNNYYSSADNNYCIGGGMEAELLVQNNYFDNVKDPHRFQDDDDTAVIAASGNHYAGISDTTLKDTRGPAFTPGYTATLEPADVALKSIVTKCAGPR
jgi:pectate lyase